MAAIRAALLDAEFERLVVMSDFANPEAGRFLGEILAALRNRTVIWNEAKRAAGKPASPGANLPVIELDMPLDAVRELAGFGDAETDHPGELPVGLADRLIAASAAKPCRVAVRSTVAGGAEARATAALGRAMLFRRAFRTNETSISEEVVDRLAAEEGLEVDQAVRPILLRYALRVLAEVEGERARRETGDYPPAEGDPVLSMPMAGRAIVQPPRSLADRAEYEPQAPSMSSEAQPAELPPLVEPAKPIEAGRRVSDVVRDSVAALERKPEKEKSGKLIGDWMVAGRLFVDLCGDLTPAHVTKEVATGFVERAARVPVMHGRPGELRGVTALEAIRWADEADAATIRGAIHAGKDPEEMRKVPRLSVATINKHLTSLQSMLGKLLPRDKEGKTALTAVRFSKKAVRRGATFGRNQLSDDRLC
ncbi:hypothetical protein FHS87_004372 [Roseomonas pecuniae]|uniref:Uncharacterized protein n=1 Tax=Muricoccus pecuniae TaxID=693023 RepID=A0A840YM35_9PROT|nr:hypothetical protein [Roseomonas pecuniae]